MSPLRRFIAGARCPNCKATDTLAFDSSDGLRVCECVACGFRDTLERSAGDATDARNRPLGQGVETVRLIDPRDPPRD